MARTNAPDSPNALAPDNTNGLRLIARRRCATLWITFAVRFFQAGAPDGTNRRGVPQSSPVVILQENQEVVLKEEVLAASADASFSRKGGVCGRS